MGTAKYSAKHPSGTVLDVAVATALIDRAVDHRITCVTAHEIAAELEVVPAEVGLTADLLEYRIIECQLGLFGYSPEKRLVKPATDIPEELRSAIERVTRDGKITCAMCWAIARQLDLPRTAVGDACEGLGLKVKNCQIGAF